MSYKEIWSSDREQHARNFERPCDFIEILYNTQPSGQNKQLVEMLSFKGIMNIYQSIVWGWKNKTMIRCRENGLT